MSRRKKRRPRNGSRADDGSPSLFGGPPVKAERVPAPAAAAFAVHTDGGCKPNPGPGGWGAVIRTPDGHHRELRGGAPHTTNNRMEMTAAIEALRSLPEGSVVDLVTDSKYLQLGVTKWIHGWRRKGWRTQEGGEVMNRDLWVELDGMLARHFVRWSWTRGHSGDRWNERADALARDARRSQEAGAPSPKAAATEPAAEPGPPEVELPAVGLWSAAAGAGGSKGGAWAAVLGSGGRTRQIEGSAPEGSANRLQLLAVVEGLRVLKKPCAVAVHTTCSYVVEGAAQASGEWPRRGWKTREGKPVANQDLWMEFAALAGRHRLSWPPPAAIPDQEEMKQAKAAATARARPSAGAAPGGAAVVPPSVPGAAAPTGV